MPNVCIDLGDGNPYWRKWLKKKMKCSLFYAWDIFCFLLQYVYLWLKKWQLTFYHNLVIYGRKIAHISFVGCSTSYEFIDDRQLHLICKFNSCWKINRIAKNIRAKHNLQWEKIVIKTKPVNGTVDIYLHPQMVQEIYK